MRRLSKIIFLPVVFFCILLTGCPGQPAARANRAARGDPETVPARPSVITDYSGKNSGAAIPQWAQAYLEMKEAGVEALDGYEDRYVFVAFNTGSNFAALGQWQEGFRPELDFALLVSRRIDRRMLLTAASYPDDEYGAFYEMLVRAASNKIWSGAERRDFFWLRRQYTDEGDYDEIETTAPLVFDAYEFFILVAIEKIVLMQQVNALFSEVTPSPPLTREQNNAVNRLKDRFFDGF